MFGVDEVAVVVEEDDEDVEEEEGSSWLAARLVCYTVHSSNMFILVISMVDHGILSLASTIF